MDSSDENKPQNQENTSTDSVFHQLIPDCRKLILSYHICLVRSNISGGLSSRNQPAPTFQNQDSNRLEYFTERYKFHYGKKRQEGFRCEMEKELSLECLSDLKFVLNHFLCWISVESFDESEFVWFNNAHFLDFMGLQTIHTFGPDSRRFTTPPKVNFFSHFNHVVELYIFDTHGGFTDEMFQYLGSLEVLYIKGSSKSQLTPEAFTHLKHLRHLRMWDCDDMQVDQAIENLYEAGSRLEKLDISECPQMTERSLRVIQGDSLRELRIANCPRVNCNELKHLRGLTSLKLEQMGVIDCREAFKCLEGSAQSLHVNHCKLSFFNERVFSCLKGISSLVCYHSSLEGLTDAAFVHLEGSIKELVLYGFSGTENLSKNILWNLAGIENFNCKSGIHIDAEDLPRLKEVFRNVSRCSLDEGFADTSTLEELQQYIEGNGGNFVNISLPFRLLNS